MNSVANKPYQRSIKDGVFYRDVDEIMLVEN